MAQVFRCFSNDPLVFDFQGDEGDKVRRHIPLLRVGKFKASGRPTTITQEQLEELAANFATLRDGGYFSDVPMRYMHIGDEAVTRDPRNMAGYIVGAAVEGDRLFVDVEFTDPKGLEMFDNGHLRSRSAEWGPWETSDGKKFANVLQGFTWCDIGAVDQLGPPIAAQSADCEVVTLTADTDLPARPAPTTPVQKPKGVVMSKFQIPDIAKVTLHSGMEVTDMSLLQLPEGDALVTFTQEVDGTTLTFHDETTHDFVVQMVTERDKTREDAAKAEAEQRTEFVKSLRTDGKILGSDEAFGEEVAFVADLLPEKYAAYVKRMQAQPPLVELKKREGDAGDEGGSELTTLAATLEYLKTAKATEAQMKPIKDRIEALTRLHNTFQAKEAS